MWSKLIECLRVLLRAHEDHSNSEQGCQNPSQSNRFIQTQNIQSLHFKEFITHPPVEI